MKRKHLRKKYSFRCPKCNKKLHAEPSLLMLMGMNTGGEGCPQCKSCFRLKINGRKHMQGECMPAKLIRA